MEWLKSIVREAVQETKLDLDLDFTLDKPSSKILDIPINLQIDGKPPVELTEAQEKNIVELAKNQTLQDEVARYIGNQFMELATTLDGKEADLIRGKIFGVSEFYRMFLDAEFIAREGVEQDTSEPDAAGVDPS